MITAAVRCDGCEKKLHKNMKAYIPEQYFEMPVFAWTDMQHHIEIYCQECKERGD
jgi:phage FluMu protein Com